MSKREIEFTIAPETDRPAIFRRVSAMVEKGLAGGDVLLVLTRPRRNKDQNAKLWPMLSDVSKQVDWYGEKLSAEVWKAMFTASLFNQKVIPAIDGVGFVAVGASTSKMTKSKFCDLIELIYAFGAGHNVKWSEPVKTAEEIWRPLPKRGE